MSDKITIAQGLRKAKKLKGELAKFDRRIQASLVYNEDSKPTFSYEESVKGFTTAQSQMVKIYTEISCANAVTKVDFEDGISIAEAVRRLQELKGDIQRYKRFTLAGLLDQKETINERNEHVLEEVQTPQGIQQLQRTKKVPYKMICNLTIKECEAKVEQLQATFEKLNDLVERSNHTTLIDV